MRYDFIDNAKQHSRKFYDSLFTIHFTCHHSIFNHSTTHLSPFTIQPFNHSTILEGDRKGRPYNFTFHENNVGGRKGRPYIHALFFMYHHVARNSPLTIHHSPFTLWAMGIGSLVIFGPGYL